MHEIAPSVVIKIKNLNKILQRERSPFKSDGFTGTNQCCVQSVDTLIYGGATFHVKLFPEFLGILQTIGTDSVLILLLLYILLCIICMLQVIIFHQRPGTTHDIHVGFTMSLEKYNKYW